MSDDNDLELEHESRARESIYAELQRHTDGGITSAPDGSLLVGFLIVTEWEAPDGSRWLSKFSGDSLRELTGWRERGYAQEVVLDAFIEPDENDVD